MDGMLEDLKKGRRQAVAKAISLVENDPAGARRLIKKIFPHTGDSVIIGITGPAGAGKSSLINKTVVALNRMGARPAVLAVDPTSHITGGAILGDRVRMAESADSGTYIRSIASRGATGAVSSSLRNSIRVLEYAGFDPIMIESVGAGQTEVEISTIADVTVVVFNPHTGDSIQAIKAGLTEIGDMYLVNKCDLEGADRLYDAVRDFIADRAEIGSGNDNAAAAATATAPRGGRKRSGPVPGRVVLKTSTKRSHTIAKFAKALTEMAALARAQKTGDLRRAKLDAELREIITSNVRAAVDEMVDSDKAAQRYIGMLASGKSSPLDAADRLTESLLGSNSSSSSRRRPSSDS
ncbi:MAG: methylmalonyl Co-A mutase-associated GTPase MeaB [Thaumarchaeota archaeon]|nr:methylmalonyl Co-A mutase-associated GTPase MeaB [Nitrososphaerota archaeon]